MVQLISKLLVANRGEIACRIERAARERGIPVVTLYTEAEKFYPQRLASRESVCLGEGPLADTYLNVDLLMHIAKETGCNAIHPGYGFLSENAAFAERCEKEGLIFIGPKAAAISLMGDKATSKQLAVKAGVPVIPGYDGEDQMLATLESHAERIGYPVLIKASAGGGGKGMRVVEDRAEFAEALAACEREAQAAFGSSRVLLEKYLLRPRHIEIQVAADHHGNAVYLGERECSIQRRHQKIVEEAPSIFVDDALRARMGEWAVALVKQIGYTNVGTVECLVDENKNAYFLEMNTRLQVEHPVTEEAFGVDLVQLQFDIAEGKTLPFSQTEVAPVRHAIECRIYAEDPDNGFLPSIGKLVRFEPPIGPGIRLDWGFAQGNDVTIHFDPMLGKLIAIGETRTQAIARMLRALEEIVCLGVKTNIVFLQRLLRTPQFVAGDIHTRVLEELSLAETETALPDAVRALAARALAKTPVSSTSRVPSPWEKYATWRITAGKGGQS